VVGNFPRGFFKGKIVLVGPSYISNSSDYSLTPFNREDEKAPNIFIHGQIIQSLIQKKTILPISKNFTYGLSFIIVLFLSILINKVKPTNGLIITISLMCGLLVVSFLIFSFFGLWLYTTHLILAIFIVYYIWVPFRAIAEYKTRFAIQEETKLLKEVESLKQNFISLMSHDLKTPVAKIAGMVDIMMHQARGQIQLEKNLKMVMDSTKELNKFITSILDLTKIESSKLNLNKSSKDINQIIKGVVEGLKFEASSQQVAIEMSLSPLYPISIDLNLFKRIASNLVENAIKYSGKGKKVQIKTWDDEKWVYIEIKDNGVGIGEDDLKHVFDKFYRVKNDASHSIKGTGLGLYLVKYFVELHGGKILVSSELVQGTKFLVQLVNA
jgi:signal transduction histidine kinase